MSEEEIKAITWIKMESLGGEELGLYSYNSNELRLGVKFLLDRFGQDYAKVKVTVHSDLLGDWIQIVTLEDTTESHLAEP